MSYIDSGSVLLNLALTGNSRQGWKLGRIANLVGDTSTGKTLLAVEAAICFLTNPPKGITPKVIYCESEAAFDKEHAQRIGLDTDKVEFPKIKTIEDFYYKIEEVCSSAKDGEGQLIILDSLDALTSKAEEAQNIEDGTYGTSKQKQLSFLLRRMVAQINDTNTCILIISQVRDIINPDRYGKTQYRTGGKSLDFYCTHIVWLAEGRKERNEETNRVYGVRSKALVTKDKDAPAFRTAEFPILWNYGVDNVSSVVEFLTGKHVEGIPDDMKILQGGAWFRLEPGGKGLRRAELIEKIESSPTLYHALLDRCNMLWSFLEQKTMVQRRPKRELLGSLDTPPESEDNVSTV